MNFSPKTIIFLIFIFLTNVHGAEKFVIASFSSSVADQTENVKRNISIACSKIDGSIIYSKSIFSFNEIVGEGSAQNGFVNGGVLYHDKVILEPGGGLCQVSSTLFNALLMAGTKIIERHRHYQPVTYVPLGLDATIMYGKKNLRMKNRYNQKLFIKASINDKSLIIKILAEKKIKYKYRIETEEEIINIPLAENSDKIRPGLSIYVYRKKFKGNKLLENFLMYKDFYPPVYRK